MNSLTIVTNPCEDTYADVLPMLYKMCWNMKKRFGGNFTEYLSSANIGFMKAYNTFRGNYNTAFSTWVWWKVRREFQMDVRNSMMDEITINTGDDIDLGILVESWDSFGKLKSDLIDSGQFVAMKEIQRLFYMNSRYIDLIPFGPIGGRGQTVKWPPDLDTEMNITGFKEAYESAIPLVIQNQPQIEIKIISLAGLAVLKLFSWNDRRHERNKDAADLALILRSYTDAGNAERIPDEMPDFVEQDDFDYIAAGARLLGKDISRIFRGNTVQKILEILEDEVGDSEQHRLIEDMIQSRAIAGDHYGKMLNLLEQMKRGIEEGN